MSQGSGVRVVLVTAPDADTARAIARSVVEEGLAACGNVLPGLSSVYRWRGAVEEAGEALVIFKTTAARVTALQERVVALHPYEVPEFLALAVESGYPPYLEWVLAEAGEA